MTLKSQGTCSPLSDIAFRASRRSESGVSSSMTVKQFDPRLESVFVLLLIGEVIRYFALFPKVLDFLCYLLIELSLENCLNEVACHHRPILWSSGKSARDAFSDGRERLIHEFCQFICALWQDCIAERLSRFEN